MPQILKINILFISFMSILILAGFT